MRISTMGAAVAVLLMTGTNLPGCREEAPSQQEPGRVLLIGIDGASPRVMVPLMEAGYLPNLAMMAEQGISGDLRSVPPLYSPRIWNTIATGKTAEQHGVAAFVKPKEADDEAEAKHLYLSHDRRVPALWNILSSLGHSVGVINWWTTYPPEKINGVMVSDHFFPEQIKMIRKTFRDGDESVGSLVYPATWGQHALEQLISGEPLSEVPDPFKGNTALPRWVRRNTLSRQYDTDNEVTRVALAAMKDFRPDVMMVFLPGIDRVSHWLWGNLEPPEIYPPGLQTTQAAREAGQAALYQYYAYTDALIGLLAADYGPDDLVLVLSDHGFEAGVSMMLLTGKHEGEESLDGVVFARGRGIPAGEFVDDATVYDIVPTVLAWLGLACAKDMEGQPGSLLPSATRIGKVASYDGIEVERTTAAASGREQDIVEHLRTLGYLEDDGSDDPAPTPDP